MEINNYIKEIERKIEDVNFYSPTIPLNYREYHKIIEDLIKYIKESKPNFGDNI
jgi:hypothetical protein